MKLKDLVHDRSLVPADLKVIERSVRAGFLTIRIRRLLNDDTSLENADDTKIGQIRMQLAVEIAKAATAYNTIKGRVEGDTDKLLSLEAIDSRLKVRYLTLLKMTPKQIRERIVLTAVWWAVAHDPTLLDPANIDDLHMLVDRRLRCAERMLYDVGRVDWNWKKNNVWQGRHWEIDAASGSWHDGWIRIFEYPRVPLHVFKDLCDPEPGTGVCRKEGMEEWRKVGLEFIYHDVALNTDSQPLWDGPKDFFGLPYMFFFKTGQGDTISAIKNLMQPYEDYKERNLLYCDQVIHVLHLEALFFAKSKREKSETWWINEVNNHALGWLRVDDSWHLSDPDNSSTFEKDAVFLVNENEPEYFETTGVHLSELQVGDHLIVFNHPAHDKAMEDAWLRLENAFVVQVYPHVLVQGHGTIPQTLAEIQTTMITAFNGALGHLRQEVKDHLANRHSGHTDLSQDEIAFGNQNSRLVRLLGQGAPTFVPSVRHAEWWLIWRLDPDKDEDKIADSPTRRALAQKVHKVVYPVDANGKSTGFAFFPLWEPDRHKNGTPIRNSAGQITSVREVKVTEQMIAAWTWYLPEKPADRKTCYVIRPKRS